MENGTGQDVTRRERGSTLANLVGFSVTDVITTDELRSMPLGMRIEFVPELREHFEEMARKMAANELTRPHLVDKPDACYSIIKNALNWRMDPHQVAAKTYSPAKGQIGIEGVLASAIMLNSGRIDDLTYEFVGDWDQVLGKWAHEQLTWPNGNKKTYKNGDPIMGNVIKWTPEDEKGLGVIGIATLKTGKEIRTPTIMLSQCHPRNAQTWPVAPGRQIIHVAERALCNQICGDILMGVHIDVGLTRTFHDQPQEPKDVTPPKAAAAVDPTKSATGAGRTTPMQESGYTIISQDGVSADEEDLIDPETGEVTEPQQEKTTRKRVSIRWDGKDMYKTKFIKDRKFEMDQIDDYDELMTLRDKCHGAVSMSSDPDAFAELGAAFDEAIASFGDGEENEPAEGGFNLADDD